MLQGVSWIELHFSFLLSPEAKILLTRDNLDFYSNMEGPRNMDNFATNRCIASEYRSDFLSRIFSFLSFSIHLQEFSLVVYLEFVSKIIVPGLKLTLVLSVTGKYSCNHLKVFCCLSRKTFHAEYIPDRLYCQSLSPVFPKEVLQIGEERTFYFLS